MSRLLNILSLILALAVLISASPTPYTEDKLSEIDALRARGVSEVSHSTYASHSLPRLSHHHSCANDIDLSPQSDIAVRIPQPESLPRPISDPVPIAFGTSKPTPSRSLRKRTMTEILTALVEKLGLRGKKRDEVVGALKAKGGVVKKRGDNEVWITGNMGHLKLRGVGG